MLLFLLADGSDIEKEKTALVTWTIITTIILTGILFFFFLARLEGGEYEPAFKVYGVTMIPAALFFGRMKNS